MWTIRPELYSHMATTAILMLVLVAEKATCKCMLAITKTMPDIQWINKDSASIVYNMTQLFISTPIHM